MGPLATRLRTSTVTALLALVVCVSALPAAAGATATPATDGAAGATRADGVADTAGERARPADAFVDSIGVNVHLHYTDTVYGRRYADIIRPRLRELGVRHVADALYTYPAVSRDNFYYRRVRELGADGLRFALLTSIATARGARSDLTLLDDVHAWTGGAVEAVIGANEPDLSGVSDWAARTRALQQDVWETVKGDPQLRHLAVIGPSPVWQPRALGDLSQWVDFGNWHPYPGGGCPSCSDVYGSSLDTRMPAYRAPSGDRPLVATETGYHNATAGPQQHRPVSERAAGRYVPRLLLEHFNRGIARSYLYELIDLRADSTRSRRDEHFGLLRNDGSRKPAFVATRNLIELLADPGPAFTTGALGFRLEGQTDRVHTTLLQKRDGRFFLALWQERPSYDTGQRANRPDAVEARRDLVVPDQRVRVVTDHTMARARLFRPGAGTRVQRAWTAARSVTVDVPDEVVLLELRPLAQAVEQPPLLDVGGACDGAPRGLFDDVPGGHAFAREVDCLRAWGVTRGVGARRFAPARVVPRWQMALFVDRIADVEGHSNDRAAAVVHRDTRALSPEARDAIARMTALGVVNGRTAATFVPFAPVSRGQVAAFVSRLRTLGDGPPAAGASDYFADDDGQAHERDINAAAAAGIVRGVGPGRYRPGAAVTRGQMAAMLTRHLQSRVADGRLEVIWRG